MKGARPAPSTIVEGWIDRRFGPTGGWLVITLAVVYLFLLGISTTSDESALPGAVSFFTQVAKLFPDAAPYAFDYRVEAWSCTDKKFVELDYRPYFPLRPDDKENRFQRIGYFYISRASRDVAKVFEDLNAYLMTRHNSGAVVDDGVAGKIGGIRLLDVRIPVPPPGGAIQRWQWHPLDGYPAEYERKIWYYTPQSQRDKNCADVAPSAMP